MHQEKYKGRNIKVDVLKRGNNWTWSYQVDNGPLRESRDRPLPHPELVLKEAISEAKAEVDRMENNPNM